MILVLDASCLYEHRSRKPWWKVYLRRFLISLNIVLAVLIVSLLLGGFGSDEQGLLPLGGAGRTQDASWTDGVPLMPSLRVTTTPVGAGIHLNGRYVGVSPLPLADLKPGQYEIKARKPGYEAVSLSVVLVFGQNETVELVLPSVTGGLEVETEPPGARVMLNGRRQSGSTPLRLEDIKPGTYSLRVKKNGYKARRASVTVREGEIAVVSERLELSRFREFGIAFWDRFFDLAYMGQRRSSAVTQPSMAEKGRAMSAPPSNAAPAASRSSGTGESSPANAQQKPGSSELSSDSETLETIEKAPPDSPKIEVSAAQKSSETPDDKVQSVPDTKPASWNREPVRRVKPRYPDHALSLRTEGTVRFELTVQRNGRVGDIRFLDDDRPRIFDHAVRRALRAWRFEPGAPEEWLYPGEIEFRLEQ